ncbi:MAG: peptidylprolyl isomerase [Desulfobacterales bacterium]
MKRFTHGLLWAVAVLWLVTGADIVLGQDTDAKSPDHVAVVNGTPILKSAFDAEFAAVMERLARSGQMPSAVQDEMLQEQIVDNLINEELLAQESRKKEIAVEPSEVDAELQGIKERFPSEAEFQSALAQGNMSEAQLQDKLRRHLAIRKLIEGEISSDFEPEEGESQKFYDEHPDMFVQPEKVRASHILIQLQPDADEKGTAEAREKIEGIQKQLKDGADFAELAKEHSEGPSSPQGGDLGYFTRGRMVKPFEDAAFGLKPGETSDVVRSDFGFHLIRVTDRQAEQTVPFDDAKDDIDRMLSEQKRREAMKVYVDGLRSQAEIQKNLN